MMGEFYGRIICKRTSPAHGTAYDIAGQGIASEKFIPASLVHVAYDILQNRNMDEEIRSNPPIDKSNERGKNIE